MSDKIDDAAAAGREQFNKASNPQPPNQGIGSEQVKNSRPAPQPKPPGNVGPAQDRLTHEEKMQKDRERAMKLHEAAKARNEQEKQLDLDKDKEK